MGSQTTCNQVSLKSETVGFNSLGDLTQNDPKAATYGCIQSVHNVWKITNMIIIGTVVKLDVDLAHPLFGAWDMSQYIGRLGSHRCYKLYIVHMYV